MELSPNDIRNFEFPTQLRGYEKEAVDNFKEQVAVTIEMLKQEHLRLTMEIESTKIQLAGLKQFEDAIKNAAIDARRNADATIANAKKEAEQILSQANSDAAQEMATRSQKRDELESQITKLELTRKSYLSKLRALINAHAEWVEEFTRTEFAEPITEETIEVTDSSEISNHKRETIATLPSTPAPIRSEQVKAAEKIITVAPEPARAAEPIAAQAEPQPEAAQEDVVDPELAAALETYRKLAEARAKAKPSQPRPAPKPAKGPVQFTNKKAGDIPEGYITPGADQINQTTDKMKVSGTEHNNLNLDAPISEEPAPEPVPAENLAEVLDNVVSKFEEEMDKAAKS
ncbi:MAG TPA: DivIVA domain-containing protein [Candidatus Acidoferrum sp.]|nr:DivIVA domain-containing protein [Candidatus Acidoferrum sp.]